LEKNYENSEKLAFGEKSIKALKIIFLDFGLKRGKDPKRRHVKNTL
jgi:hypothetical protein